MSDRKEELDRVERASMLYDFYGCLLSEAKREVMAMYHDDDLSLSEIAEELGQSRQAVHYTLKKAEKALEAYEDKLGLVAGYEKNQKLAQSAFGIIEESAMSDEQAARLRTLIAEIAE